ncbi:hypothetical protein GBAR_LOCUS2676, partial [Geodia barretti]
MFFRSSRNSSEMDFGDEDSGNDDSADTPRPSHADLMGLRSRACAKNGDMSSVRAEAEHFKIREMSIEEEEGSQGDGRIHVQTAVDRRKLTISEKINRDLDETAIMLEKLTQSLFPV